ncbi:class I glutamine amidotransferase-like protein [Pseudovirgaria hyperparasitica]|uniref:Class I glutamine amidotransferase-like protein n=1 Tax=Pseudovirgaria hyperparasitica TaxID=470096 RepID=A0A6A6WE43_9PEZI|nr:class I glutamine amidotransferase-like protein [Pseudovirgaria hyperparasitica]KAF2760260.1 class I glutamine amidotransferase-like protein [Pseudovirgaria hyperparasitica]
MSAIADIPERTGPIQVLFTLHPGFDSLDYVGPMEALHYTKHEDKSIDYPAFQIKTCAKEPAVQSAQGITIKADMDFEDAEADLEEFDVLIVPGGNYAAIIEKNDDPIPLIKAWAELQRKDPSKERTLFSVCTGALFLAKAGVLQGLAATTHPEHYTRLEMICQDESQKDLGVRTDVMEEKYVVNNARFELGERWDENPFIMSQRPDARRKSSARRGSEAWKLSKRRESIVKRAKMPLGGLRVITSGGITTGIDASLYLIAALVSVDSASEVAKFMQYNWSKGVTVEGIDV